MTFTIEPMLTLGTIDYEVWQDGWTAVTGTASAPREVPSTRRASSPRTATRNPHPAVTRGALPQTGGARPAAS